MRRGRPRSPRVAVAAHRALQLVFPLQIFSNFNTVNCEQTTFWKKTCSSNILSMSKILGGGREAWRGSTAGPCLSSGAISRSFPASALPFICSCHSAPAPVSDPACMPLDRCSHHTCAALPWIGSPRPERSISVSVIWLHRLTLQERGSLHSTANHPELF